MFFFPLETKYEVKITVKEEINGYLERDNHNVQTILIHFHYPTFIMVFLGGFVLNVLHWGTWELGDPRQMVTSGPVQGWSAAGYYEVASINTIYIII